MDTEFLAAVEQKNVIMVEYNDIESLLINDNTLSRRGGIRRG